MTEVGEQKGRIPSRLAGVVAVALALLAVDHARALLSEPIVFDPEARAPGTFPAQWIHGSKSAMDNDDPPVQVHAYNEHTIIMRENKAINYEGAFMYLFFGNDRGLLIDQGSTSSPARRRMRRSASSTSPLSPATNSWTHGAVSTGRMAPIAIWLEVPSRS